MNEKEKSIWAKSAKKADGSAVTLADHTQDLLTAFEVLRAPSLHDKLRNLIRLSIHCHDFGKVLPAFQIRTLGNKDYQPFDVTHNIPHSLVSALLIDQARLAIKIKEIDNNAVQDYTHFVLSAVAYHHWRDNFADLIQVYDDEFRMLCEKLIEETDAFTQPLLYALRIEMRNIPSLDQHLIAFNKEMASGILNGVAFANYVTPPYQLYWMPKRAQMTDDKAKDWILISGFLMRCDHFASFCEQEGIPVENTDKPLQNPHQVMNGIKKAIKETDSQKIWQITQTNRSKHENTILVAPTGFGKTEFAFLWGADQKTFYTLPLRSAVNQVFERAQSVFNNGSPHDELVGLLHSDADVYLLGDGGQSENLKLYDFSRQLSFPVVVSTGDQFFPYALRPPGYEKIYATFSYSKLVIDEVQAYDPKAAAIAVKFMEDVVRMGGKFLLMTATLPRYVEDRIRERAGQEIKVVNVYEDKIDAFKLLSKHNLRLRPIDNPTDNKRPDFTLPDSELTYVVEEAKKGLRVLVIVNTVRQAQRIYNKLRENNDIEQIWLLHSRFTLSDRKKLESEISREFSNPKPTNEHSGKVLVATQVVEASLDLDADVLFTELAPMDALVQRMGRVMRRIRLNSGDEIVMKSDQADHVLDKPYIQTYPNVNIWTFVNGLESGNSKVYDRELLGITLKILCMSAEERGKDASEMAKAVNAWIGDKSWTDLNLVNSRASDPVTQSKKAKKSKRGKKNEQDESETSNGPSLIIPDSAIAISEYDKFLFVSALYATVNPRGKYLQDFYTTLEILDAGYMSDRREDAHKIFREISSLSVIPIGQGREVKDRLKNDLIAFFGSNSSNHLYTFFKRDILTNYVVSIPMNAKKSESIRHQTPELWAQEIMELSDFQRERLAKWFSGIYFVSYEYDNQIGIIQTGNPEINDVAFL